MEKLSAIRGMLPFAMVVFLNAFVDLGHKIIIQNTVFKVYDGSAQIILTAIVNGLILLPFILLFSPSGLLADKYPKNKIMRIAAWVAVGLTLLITLCYYQGWFWPAFVMTFLLAMQSAFYSPAKYGYIKILVGKDCLAQANGVIQAVTLVAILAGMFIFSILFEMFFAVLDEYHLSDIMRVIAPLGWLLVVNSIFEVLMAYRLPCLENQNDRIQLSFKDCVNGQVLIDNIRPVLNDTAIRISIIGLAVFWSVSQVMLAAFPAFIKDSLAITNTVVIQGILAVSGVGIVVGSLLAGRWSRRYIETGLVPVGAAGFTACLFLLPSLESVVAHTVNFFILGLMGGLFIVPLNSLIQFHAGEGDLGRVLAGNNLMQNIAMLSFLVITAFFSYSGLTMATLLWIIAVVALLGGVYTVVKLPQSLVRFLIARLISGRYHINVQGFNHIPSRGGVLLLGNHISWIDWAIIQLAYPRPVRFVMLRTIYELWYLKWFFQLTGAVPISNGGDRKTALKKISRLLNNGEVVCFFPEGSVSQTRHLTEFRHDYELACDDVSVDVVIQPFYLRGLWGSHFSRANETGSADVRHGARRDIVVAFGKPIPKATKVDVLKRRVFDLSVSTWRQYVETLPSIPEAWIDTVKGKNSNMAIADTQNKRMSGVEALTAAIILSRKFEKINTKPNIGLLLPCGVVSSVANMAVLMNGQALVNLNYSASEDVLLKAVGQAEISCIFSSRLFVEKLKKKKIFYPHLMSLIPIYYLEDINNTIGQWERVKTLLIVKFLPSLLLKIIYCNVQDPEDTAAVLFSSGSESEPKGVMLSHRNIMANVKQCADVLSLRADDVVMASLPQFHAFGLTVTQFMPLIEGVPMICHADPMDVVGSAKAVAKYRVTFMCGTSTFLKLYVKNNKVHPLMLSSLRLVVSGAEKLKSDVRLGFKSKFNQAIYEGYGATETTPVASVNLPNHLDTDYWQIQIGEKEGTVGMPLPGSSFKVVNPDTLQELPTGEQGLVMLGGCQVMKGYLKNPKKTAEVIVKIDGVRWYKTGDKGYLDKDGFLNIVDRYSRFAKLAGEMISLTAVENAVRSACNRPGLECVAISFPDNKKGEKIVLLVMDTLTQKEILEAMLASNCNPLMIPSVCFTVDAIPILGSGKVDFGRSKKMAQSLVSGVDI